MTIEKLLDFGLSMKSGKIKSVDDHNIVRKKGIIEIHISNDKSLNVLLEV